MKSMNLLTDKVKGMILIGLFIIVLGVCGAWFFNFIALSDTNLYDDNNKLVDLSIGDVDGNYKDTYVFKSKFESFILTLSNIFNNIYALFGLIFMAVFLFGLFVSKKDSVFSFIKSIFD